MQYSEKLRQAAHHDFPTAQAADIFRRLLPEWADLFLRKNEQYKNVDNKLGAAGVFPDVYRKVGALRGRVWDNEPTPDGAEETREVILDLIGHLFLMLHMLEEGNGFIGDSHDSVPGTGYAGAVEIDVNGQAWGGPFLTDPIAREDLDDEEEYTDEERAAQKAEVEGKAPDLNYFLHEQIGAAYRVGRAPGWLKSPDEQLGEIVDSIRARINSRGVNAPLQIHNHYAAPIGDGWEQLPDGVREALIALANGGRITDRSRDAVQAIVAAND